MVYQELIIASNVSAPKLRKAFKTGKLSLTSVELKRSGSVNHLHPESYEKALKARNANRGVRLNITRHEIKKSYKKAQGGSIWSKVWGGIKSAYTFVKDSGLLSKAVDAAVPALATYVGAPQAAVSARAAIKSLTGVGVDGYDSESDQEGGRITVADVKAKAKQAQRYAKQKGIITDLVDLGERKLIEKATKSEHVDMIETVRRSVKERYGVGIKSSGKTKSARFAKGSPEAKEHMAKLRKMRKTGGSFRL
ncbi:hypothetical protein PC110_g18097 [Phytophthora cactorum]|uniref:Uncharacterized protein n=1 Tax=Phytophthora cactorum TaxID=29920 RepID=A0A329RQP9_9STRA|nr:hypothetical protein PC110_g18097 [Phytophthora cactorum]